MKMIIILNYHVMVMIMICKDLSSNLSTKLKMSKILFTQVVHNNVYNEKER